VRRDLEVRLRRLEDIRRQESERIDVCGLKLLGSEIDRVLRLIDGKTRGIPADWMARCATLKNG
jgi:hypothetical protein